MEPADDKAEHDQGHGEAHECDGNCGGGQGFPGAAKGGRAESARDRRLPTGI